MTTLPDIMNSIGNAFPIFSGGQKHIDEFFDRYPHDQNGIRQRWEVYDSLSKNVFEFLRERFPYLRNGAHAALCDLQMCSIKDTIERTERWYRCCQSIVDSETRKQ